MGKLGTFVGGVAAGLVIAVLAWVGVSQYQADKRQGECVRLATAVATAALDEDPVAVARAEGRYEALCPRLTK